MHLGASGLVFGYLTYLVARGLIARNLWWVLGGLVVLAFYGGLLWGMLPTPRVSWLGHLFGAIGGVLAAWVLHGESTKHPRHRRRRCRKKLASAHAFLRLRT